ncbi:MAG: peptide deformylase [Clostridia bacterium]|nr:peptide deformylase [Clostridia bacterium]
MVRPIMHDPLFLSQPSQSASAADLSVLTDLVDTLMYHRKGCVGMAANMIGVRKRIIAFDDAGMIKTMLNPEIIAKSGEYEAEEGCLSLMGTRKTKRYEKITVRFDNAFGQKQTQQFSGWTAQIIQHEIDHCNGILI